MSFCQLSIVDGVFRFKVDKLEEGTSKEKEGKPAKVIEMCRLTAQTQPTAALVKVYQIPDLPTAEKAYRTFVEDQGLLPVPRRPR